MIRIAPWLLVMACRIGAGGDQTDMAPPKDVLALADRDLGAEEQRLLDRNGLVVMGHSAVQSFHIGYTALFHAHAPVLVTADSLMYAWHASYDKILTQLEREALVPALAEMLAELRTKLAAAEAPPQIRADLDVYLAVAASLERGALQPPIAGGDPTAIATLYERGTRAEGLGAELFGVPMDFDFSMLKPRGHYTTLPELQRYFRAMSWLGRAELRFGHREDPSQPWAIDRRAYGAMVLLGSLFDARTRASWQAIDTTINALVGPPDSLSLPGLEATLAKLPAAASDEAIGAAFVGPSAQKIHTQLEHAHDGSLAFLLLGQRYVFDASVLGDLVEGSISSAPPRLMPTPLDIGHVVFRNPAATRLLAPELERYGAPYAQALAAKAAEPLPDTSVAEEWLGALRELSPDHARDAGLPAPLDGDAWSRRMLATQLASWAELRHDNLLYTKQSFTVELGCEYPAAYVDPYPAFYGKLATLATRLRKTISALPYRATRADAIDHYLAGMAKTMARLQAIAERERANGPMTGDDLDFINHMVSIDGRNAVCTTTIDPKGWYAELFYEQREALDHWPVVADVHTQPTDATGDMVGKVLHVGTGMPRMMAVTIRHDGGRHAQTYRGIVSSYGELITDHFERLTDEVWRQKIGEHMVGTPPWLDELIAH